MEQLNRFFWAISGHQREIIATTKVDNYRATIVGAILLMVGIYAALAWTFFFSTVMDHMVLAGIAGIFAGFFILLFDRALICSISYGKKNIWALSFRFLLALLLGVFLSQPIIMKLYEPDIKREAAILVDQKNQERHRELEQVYGAELQLLLQRKAEINQSLADKKRQLLTNEEAFKKEMDGSAGTGRWGYNVVSRKKESIYLKDQEELQALNKTSQPELRKIETRLDTIEAIVNRQLTAFMNSTRNQGFLIQAEALQSLLEKDKTHTLRNRYYLLMIILTLIELSALLSKLILETGSYGKKVELILEVEKTETTTQQELFRHHNDQYKTRAMERETLVIDEFFDKTQPVAQEKTDTWVNQWRNHDTQPFWNTWGIIQHRLLMKLPVDSLTEEVTSPPIAKEEVSQDEKTIAEPETDAKEGEIQKE